MKKTKTSSFTHAGFALHGLVAFLINGLVAFLISALAAPAAIGAPAATFRQTNLVSNQAGKAKHLDSDLINPWGAVTGNDGLFWIADNGTGKATLYDESGVKSPLIVTLPKPAGSGPASPTGQAHNTAPSDFLGDSFIFDSEDGTILGWSSGSTANVRVDRSGSGSIYKGLALARSGSGTLLYAADFHNNKIDVFDSGYNPVSGSDANRFVDPQAPGGYAPFNIHLIGNRLYVAYARQDAAAEDDVTGDGNGFISIFTTNGTFVKRFATGSNAGGKIKQLNSPWGMAVAPKNFGRFAGKLLIGNFGSGRIAAFSRAGAFLGYLASKSNRPIRIAGLWEIFFGRNGVGSSRNLYFTAGPNDEADGLFGYIAAGGASAAQATRPTPKPTPAVRPTSAPVAQPTATPMRPYPY